MSALKWVYLRLACTCEETCLSVSPPNASLYASSTCRYLRLLASPFGQAFTLGGRGSSQAANKQITYVLTVREAERETLFILHYIYCSWLRCCVQFMLEYCQFTFFFQYQFYLYCPRLRRDTMRSVRLFVQKRLKPTIDNPFSFELQC